MLRHCRHFSNSLSGNTSSYVSFKRANENEIRTIRIVARENLNTKYSIIIL